MHLTRKTTSRTAFLVVVLLSALSLAYTTLKYVGCYNALANFKVDVTNISFVSTPSLLSVTMKLNISNPTNYGDLHLNGILGSVSYEGENHTAIVYLGTGLNAPFIYTTTPWWQLPQSQASINRPISPYFATSVLMNLTASGDDAKTFNAYFVKQGALQQNIKWQLVFSVSIDTPIYLKTENLQYQFDL